MSTRDIQTGIRYPASLECLNEEACSAGVTGLAALNYAVILFVHKC